MMASTAVQLAQEKTLPTPSTSPCPSLPNESSKKNEEKEEEEESNVNISKTTSLDKTAQPLEYQSVQPSKQPPVYQKYPVKDAYATIYASPDYQLDQGYRPMAHGSTLQDGPPSSHASTPSSHMPHLMYPHQLEEATAGLSSFIEHPPAFPPNPLFDTRSCHPGYNEETRPKPVNAALSMPSHYRYTNPGGAYTHPSTMGSRHNPNRPPLSIVTSSLYRPPPSTQPSSSSSSVSSKRKGAHSPLSSTPTSSIPPHIFSSSNPSIYSPMSPVSPNIQDLRLHSPTTPCTLSSSSLPPSYHPYSHPYHHPYSYSTLHSTPHPHYPSTPHYPPMHPMSVMRYEELFHPSAFSSNAAYLQQQSNMNYTRSNPPPNTLDSYVSQPVSKKNFMEGLEPPSVALYPATTTPTTTTSASTTTTLAGNKNNPDAHSREHQGEVYGMPLTQEDPSMETSKKSSSFIAAAMPPAGARFRCACGKLFQKLCGLKSHIKVHQAQGAQLRVNDQGELEWTTESGIPVLAPVEEIERSYVCDLCHRSFLRKQDLRRHKVTHSEKYKRFKCDNCDTTFSRSDALYRHNKARRCRGD